MGCRLLLVGLHAPASPEVATRTAGLIQKPTAVPEQHASDKQAACAVCRWLQVTDRIGNLSHHVSSSLPALEWDIASIEGWILGVT